jgi:hypothetical protein
MNIDLSDANYIEIVAGLIGAIVLVIGNSLSTTRTKVKSTGVKVEGLVFALEEITGPNDYRRRYYIPIIRFITLEKEWVTEKYSLGLGYKSMTISSSYKEGDKVTVIYDPKNITTFIIDDFTSKVIGPVSTIIGVLTIIGAIIHFVINGNSAV